jgi:hypothetical protein
VLPWAAPKAGRATSSAPKLEPRKTPVRTRRRMTPEARAPARVCWCAGAPTAGEPTNQKVPTTERAAATRSAAAAPAVAARRPARSGPAMKKASIRIASKA